MLWSSNHRHSDSSRTIGWFCDRPIVSCYGSFFAFKKTFFSRVMKKIILFELPWAVRTGFENNCWVQINEFAFRKPFLPRGTLLENHSIFPVRYTCKKGCLVDFPGEILLVLLIFRAPKLKLGLLAGESFPFLKKIRSKWFLGGKNTWKANSLWLVKKAVFQVESRVLVNCNVPVKPLTRPHL